jgi:hypothetical protein
MADRRYTYQMCECGDPWCAGCNEDEEPTLETEQAAYEESMRQADLEAAQDEALYYEELEAKTLLAEMDE